MKSSHETASMKIYYSNIQKYQALSTKLAKDLKQISLLRLAVFVLSLVIITYLANERQIGLVLVITPACILGFGWLVKRYNRVARQQQHYRYLQEINQQEILRLENKLSNFSSGTEFINRDHSYTSDLDIFGPHSLFQLVNRTTTESGRNVLANWLSRPISKQMILDRQHAIQELVPKLEWRQDFQASAMPHQNAKSDYQKLLYWFEKPVVLLPQRTKYLIIAGMLSILSTSAMIYFLANLFSPGPILYLIPLIIILVINGFVLNSIKPLAVDIIEHTHHNVSILQGYLSLIISIKSEKFASKRLEYLRANLYHNYSAASEINSLKQILELFQLRGYFQLQGFKREFSNFFYVLSNAFWLLDIHCILKIEKWKTRNRSNLKQWSSSISEFEVLNSMAGFAYSNAEFIFPEITEEPYSIHFRTLGHPLLSKESNVHNDFDLKGQGAIAMITGSNMAGKSTFLRTIGVNLVLAFMGAPICARSGKVSVLNIFTSMRTQDNLEAGISSFHAELKRVEQLLKSIANGQPILFLLDEMFKGTNSEDRHKGGFSLIKQLSELNAFGIIATHDLELARLSNEHGIATNYSFNSQMQNGEMIFSYRLTDGICSDFNASELMKSSGIKIIPKIE